MSIYNNSINNNFLLKKLLFSITSIFFVIALLFYRPMLLGYSSAITGLAINIVVFYIYMAFKKDLSFDRNLFRIYVISMLFSLLSVILNLAFSTSASAINNLLILSLFNATCLLAFDRKKARYILRSIKYCLRIIVFSGLITSLIVGLDYYSSDNWSLFEVPIKDRGDFLGASILFPFSTLPYPFTTFEYVFSRNTFLSIEPGVAPVIIFLWRYLEGNSSSNAINRINNFIFIFALIATISTTAPLFIFLHFAFLNTSLAKPLQNFSIKKLFFITVIGLIAVYIFLYFPYFGYLNKIETHGTSFDDRIEWYSGEDSNIFRISIMPLLILYYILIKKYVENNFLVLYLGVLIVSALNVLAFTPLFFLFAYVCLNQEKIYEKSTCKYTNQ